jgi:hypothetical protein
MRTARSKSSPIRSTHRGVKSISGTIAGIADVEYSDSVATIPTAGEVRRIPRQIRRAMIWVEHVRGVTPEGLS